MSAIENAKQMSKEEVVEKIAALDLMEYGLCHEKLSDRLNAAVTEAQEEGKELGVVAALNNADTDKVLLEVLKADPAKVMEGIAIAAYAMGAEKMSIQIPEEDTKTAEAVKEAADAAGVEIVMSIVDIRANKGSAILHIVTAANLADAFADKYEAGVYVSVNGEPVKKAACDTKVSDVADLSGAKAVLAGYNYYTPETIADMTVAEANIDNGVLKVLGEKDCIVSETEKKVTASRRQSCGKCVFCREGLLQLQAMQKDMTDGKGKEDYMAITKEIGEAMRFSTPCTMGQTSSEIALSAIDLFESEYVAHYKKKECPAGVCFSSETVYIDPKLCTGCGDCMDVCPKDCIEGKAKFIHMIDDFDCDRCGKCIEECPENAIIKTSGKLPKLPNRLTKVGRFKR
ncbi:MAG: NADH-ubiquinone oxidoreductase-F iron-sulfur binding region domain-containing protein [Hespellia sp.]|nr:NADH-ubiquinone oxidoreductase-F iron-sulfur binding region domain-containing protein [Hespellia sp.]